MFRFSQIALIFLIIIAGCGPSINNDGSDKILGVKIYSYDKPLPPLFDEWDQIGINTVFTDVSLFRKEEFRSLAKEHNIRSFLILPIYFDAIELHKNPDLYSITADGKLAIDDWVEFACPSRKSFKQKKIEYISNLVKELNPDGLSIDFIRNFVYWEKVSPDFTLKDFNNSCFDDTCMVNFQAATGIHIPDSIYAPSQYAEWIKENQFEQWVDWKCSVITNMVRDIASAAKKLNPNIRINIHAVPWRKNDFGGAEKIIAGQNLIDLNEYTDYISPMTYEHMVKRDPQWVHSVVDDFYNQTGGKIIPSIQVNKSYLDNPLTINEFKKSLKEALKEPSKGVIFWSWDQLDDQPEKKNVAKEIFDNITPK